MIYHKFSHSAAFYTFNGKNVNVKLELAIIESLTGVEAETTKSQISFINSGEWIHLQVFLQFLKTETTTVTSCLSPE